MQNPGQGAGVVPAVQSVVLSATQANSTVTPAVMTGCTFTVPPGKVLMLLAQLVFTSAATTTGGCLGVRVANPTGGEGTATGSTHITVNQSSAALAPLAMGGVFSVAANANALVECIGANTVAGNNTAALQAVVKNNNTTKALTVTVEFRSEVASSAITAQIGSGATAIIH